MSGAAAPAAGIELLGVVTSASETSRTRTLVEAVLAGAEAADASVTTRVVVVGDPPLAFADGTRAERQQGATRAVLEAVAAADAVVLGCPTYRAAPAAAMKNLLDLLPHGGWDGDVAALRAKAVAVVVTGASPHHFLAVDRLAEILRGFFGAWVVPPGVYAAHGDFADGRLAAQPVVELADTTGRALVALQRAIASESALQAVRPQL